MKMATSPRAIIHKQILEIAASNSTVSMEEIAEQVSGATLPLVERVLAKYGDPGDDSLNQYNGHENGTMTFTDTTQNSSEITTDDPESLVNAAELTDRQLETLRAIYAFPTASQRDLAKILGVSSATISQRVNSIDGFDWEKRREFAETIVETERSERDLHRTIEQLSFDCQALKRRLDETEQEPPSDSVFTDPEFLLNLVRTCLEDDSTTETQEVQLTIDAPNSTDSLRIHIQRK